MTFSYNRHYYSYEKIFLLAASVFLLGTLQVFDDDVKNKLLIYFSLITLILGILSLQRAYEDNWLEEEVDKVYIKIPDSIKCYFGDRDCDNGDVTSITFLHVLVYVIAGIFFPDRYLFILFVSIVFESFELTSTHYNAKWILDPTANLLGYFLGNMINKIYHKYY